MFLKFKTLKEVKKTVQKTDKQVKVKVEKIVKQNQKKYLRKMIKM